MKAALFFHFRIKVRVAKNINYTNSARIRRKFFCSFLDENNGGYC